MFDDLRNGLRRVTTTKPLRKKFTMIDQAIIVIDRQHLVSLKQAAV